MISINNRSNYPNFQKDNQILYPIGRIEFKKDSFNPFFPKNKENHPLAKDNSMFDSSKENYFTTSTNNPINSKNNGRIFGKDISNMINQKQIQEQQFKKQSGRSLSVNMAKIVNQSFKGAKGEENNQKTSFINTSFEANMETCDQENLNYPSQVAVYVREIFEYLKENELKNQSKGTYMSSTQTDVNEKMRSILVDWLVDVHLKFKLRPETLFLTINLLDRYLEKISVPRQKLQLVGVASMLIACKYEEIYAPETKDFVFVTDRAYTKPEIHEMEGKILGALDFNLTSNSSLKFLDRYSKVNDSSEKTYNLARFLIELSLVDYKMLKYSPSHIAASSLYLSNKILKKNQAWNDLMEKNTNFNESELRICAKDLFILIQNSNKENNNGKGNTLTAVKRKFSDSKFNAVSKIRFEQS